jgi:hypothetical protein
MQGAVPASVRVGDEVCREWLAWRGFAGALRAFDADAAGVAGLPVERLAELVLGATASSELGELTSLLAFLSSRFFCRLDGAWAQDVRRLESSLLKLYAVRALQAGRRARVLEVR